MSTVLYLYGEPIEIVDARLHLSLVGNRWFGTLELRARYVGERESEDTFVIAAFSADMPEAESLGVGEELAGRLGAQSSAWRDEQILKSTRESMHP
jgi:hypothetical protein